MEIWEYDDRATPRLLAFWDPETVGTDPTDLYYEIPVLWLNASNTGMYSGPEHPTIGAIFSGGYSGGLLTPSEVP